jgi:3-hydroxybutyryl-CoA dehydrogenase
MSNLLPLNKVAVIGTGNIGTQIAMQAASTGYKVKVFDTKEGAFLQALEIVRRDLENKSIQPVIPWEQWNTCAKAIQQMLNIEEAMKDAELVIEAVPENLELKKKVFKDIGEKAPLGAILATNSSSIPISRLESYSGRPEYCLNIHFYYPMQGINIVDIMGGTCTLPKVMEKGIAWVRSLGCIPLTVKKECLGFCFNRVWRAVKREVLYMWANGFVDFRDIDRAWMVYAGMKEGPFGIMDKTGLELIYDIEMVYFSNSKDPKDRPPDLLKEKIEKGEVGIKSGKGFYTYPNPEYLRPDFLNPSD